MEHAALIVMGPLGLQFLIYGIINYVIYFRFGGSSEVLDPSVHRFLCGHICWLITFNSYMGWDPFYGDAEFDSWGEI